MQFVTHGPDIPDALLQAHEEGRVVFFCGAGISYPAGLPGFSGLVDRLYQELSVSPDPVQQSAIKAGQFDTAIGLLEADLVGGREMVRRSLATILQPNLLSRNATTTHEALLALSQNSDGCTRLITTNFDRVFEEVRLAKSLSIPDFKAPLLPVPKKRWDGLVYLHGVLPVTPTASDLDRLVLSSGDFGLAYLTERWAARFVSELFRNFIVCFVGYSINDPVLRYMMDALAADRLLGESPPEMFAFGSFSKGKELERANEWKAKNVTPILYREHQRHAYLHKTLRAWADTYRDGSLGKEQIVTRHALTRPSASTKQDDFVGRMLWALSDKSGLPAKRFANFNPAPSLEWLLGPFAHERFVHGDLARFGVPPQSEVNTNLRFSLIKRPASYDRAPQMLLVSGGETGSKWDDVMFHLARWLTRHLDDPRLLIWIVERGGQLNDCWLSQIESRLDWVAELERNDKTSELDEIRLNSPKAIPSPLMRTLWWLLLSGRVTSPRREPDLYRWQGRLKCEGLTTTLRLELRELLAPKVVLKKPFHWPDNDSKGDDEPRRIKQLVDCELVLAADDVHSALRDLAGENWTFALPRLLEDFQQLLRDALDLLRELGEADDHRDRSHWVLPSITPHSQNRGHHDWVCLIELLRDAWWAVYGNDSARAIRIAQNWFDLPYPTFKRLALFAASQDGCIQPVQWLEWLLADDAWWLWSTETGREVYRLFVQQGRHLAGTSQERLEAAILAGPPREMYRGNVEAERWQGLVDRSVWLHLAKLNESGLAMGATAAVRLAELSASHPRWQLATNESDEFGIWWSGTGDPDFDDSRDVDIVPRKRQELVKWLSKPIQELSHSYEDTWRDVCRTRFFHSLLSLRDLAQENIWPAGRWREALQVWAEEGNLLRSWHYAAPLVKVMPDAVLQEIAHDVTWWIKAASKSINCYEDIMMALCSRVLGLPLEAGLGPSSIRDGVEIYDPVDSAINHPIGYITRAIISVWFKRSPGDNDLLPADLKPIFTTLCDVQVERFRHGRVLLGEQLIAFFRVDQPWTEQHLLPLFGWSNPFEAKGVWEGFLLSPRLYPPLITTFKSQFLDSANYYFKLGNQRQQFVAFLTYAALGPTEGYTLGEFRSAIGSLPQEGLEKSAQVLTQALESAADQCEEYWKNRVQPFWQQVWPKSRDLATPRIANSLACLAIAARGEFPVALATVQHWLKPIERPHSVVHELHESGLCQRFPAEAVLLLNAVIAEPQSVPEKLEQCLREIVQASPQLGQDARYRRLQEHFRMRGM
ncbi:anti-phage defense-associated sirtuin Dsr1 [Aeromonas aquatilis]